MSKRYIQPDILWYHATCEPIAASTLSEGEQIEDEFGAKHVSLDWELHFDNMSEQDELLASDDIWSYVSNEQ